ncbi:MAG: Crp/Fnr family transcriptional regulator [Polyangiaceae bacterium]|nr:Crp/Fnr family transcriptional regulator [Polyangiaceae bacterium]
MVTTDPPPSDVPSIDRQRLLSRFGRSFSAGDVLFREGDDAAEAYLLQEGRIRLIKRVGGGERSLRILRSGDLFGEVALLPGARRNTTAVALEDGTLLALDHAMFQQVLSTNPDIGMRILQQLVRRLRDAEDQIEILMLDGSESKVVAALIKLCEHNQAQGTEKGILVISPLELSAQIGLDVDTVKRTVKQLRDQGYLKIVNEKVEIPSLAALSELYGLLGIKDQISGRLPDHQPPQPAGQAG